MNDATGKPPILRFDSISKHFAGVTALSNVSFEILEGHCHALMGENGAGTSTLGKIVAGIHQPSTGTVYLRGRPIHFGSPLDAGRAGIGMVHQELCFCSNLTVAENLCLGNLPTRLGFLRRNEMRARARAMLAEIGADIDVDVPIGSLSTGQEQMVQIAGAVGTGARIIVMDEPTSSLASAEADRLFALIDRLKERGSTISPRHEHPFAGPKTRSSRNNARKKPPLALHARYAMAIQQNNE